MRFFAISKKLPLDLWHPILTKYSLAMVISFFCQNCFCQNETAKWFFGYYAGLDFMTQPPTVSTGSSASGEGCASIATGSGNTLFYTDGLTIWNATHQIMPNGTGLFGNNTSTQSSLIVPQPGNDSLYYIFTTAGGTYSYGLCYSIVNMNLAGGTGSVIIKNTLLNTPTSEKLTGSVHCNGSDIWVVSHDWNSNVFRAYLLTSTGLNQPVLSSAGSSLIVNGAYAGAMKISPTGKKIGMAVEEPGYFEIFDFDPSTGAVYNAILLDSASYAYGCEFSPDGSKFYGSCFTSPSIIQWNLCAGTDSAIIASKFVISTLQTASMQLAKNGVIYCARPSQSFLTEISTPNNAGLAAGCISTGISLAPNLSTACLPNFVQSFLRGVGPAPDATIDCQTVSFAIPAVCTSAGTSTVNWNFGDSISGTSNFATGPKVGHLYSQADTYTVTCLIHHDCYTDTVRQEIIISQVNPQFSLSAIAPICAGESTTILASPSNYEFHWTGTVVNNSFLATPSITTVYSVTAIDTSSGCKSTRTFTLVVLKCLDVSDSRPSAFDLYPNPATPHEKIKLSTGNCTIRVFSTDGNIMASKTLDIDSNQFEISGLLSGVYIVEAKNEKSTVYRKLIVVDER